MAIIRKESIPPKKEQVTIRLDPDVLRRLDLYCRFIESCQNYVVEQSLKYTFNKDRHFQDWLLKKGTTGADDREQTHASEANGR